MARSIHNAVFFVGEQLPHTTYRLASMTFELCKNHVAQRGDLIFIDNLESVEKVLAKHHNDPNRTFFINGAPCDRTLLMKLDRFGGGKAIVHVDLDDGSPNPQHGASSLLNMIRDVPILQLTDGVGGESHEARILWVLRGLKDLNQPPIPTTIIEKVLQTTTSDRALATA